MCPGFWRNETAIGAAQLPSAIYFNGLPEFVQRSRIGDSGGSMSDTTIFSSTGTTGLARATTVPGTAPTVAAANICGLGGTTGATTHAAPPTSSLLPRVQLRPSFIINRGGMALQRTVAVG
jgi:hypothetical protein